MEKIKENVLQDFINMIQNAWTFDKMTEGEKKRLFETLHDIPTTIATKGTYQQRWEILQAIFSAYLAGLGYSGFDWRETEKQPF